MIINKNKFGIKDTLNNNKIILTLAEKGLTKRAMKLLLNITNSLYSSFNSNFRIKTLGNIFNFIGTDFDGSTIITLNPNKISNSKAKKIAKVNLLYVTKPLAFFKYYAHINIQKSLKWLVDYNVNCLNPKSANNVKNILKSLHFVDLDNDNNADFNDDSADYKIITKKGKNSVVSDNASDGSHDTGAFIYHKEPELRNINMNDINILISNLKKSSVIA